MLDDDLPMIPDEEKCKRESGEEFESGLNRVSISSNGERQVKVG